MLNRIYDTIPYDNETLYRCNRVWEAWNYWTMTRDDFEEVEPYIMIWDVLDWFYSNIELPVVERRRTCDTILFEWKDKRKPLQDQPIECIEYINSLLIS